MKIWVHDVFKHDLGQQSFKDITSHEDSTVYASVSLMGDLQLPVDCGAKLKSEQILLAATVVEVL